MSKVIELTDEQYVTIERVAAAQGLSLDAYLSRLIDDFSLGAPSGQRRTTDDWLRYIGLSEDDLRRVDAEIGAYQDADTR